MKKLYFVFGVAGALFLIWLYFNYDPAKYSFFLQCPFHRLTGLDCPGCGSQRAVHCLLHGDVAGAFHQNLLLMLSLPLLAVQAGYKVKNWFTHKNEQWPLLYHKATPYVVGAITITFFIVRNLPSYPFKH